MLIAATGFELAFGCWLVAGTYRCLTRWIALGWFTSLAGVAFTQAVGGAPSCACLGQVHADPWLMFAFDGLAVLALWMWSTNDLSSQPRLAMALCLSLLPAAAFLGLVSLPHSQPLFAEIDLGEIEQEGQRQQAFEIRNDSGALVEVTAIETSCPCIKISLRRDTVAAGQLLRGNVMVDLRDKPEFVGTLVIEAKGLTQRGLAVFLLTIRARVYSASLATADPLEERARAYGGEPPQSKHDPQQAMDRNGTRPRAHSCGDGCAVHAGVLHGHEIAEAADFAIGSRRTGTASIPSRCLAQLGNARQSGLPLAARF
jgi:hypothetical protein